MFLLNCIFFLFFHFVHAPAKAEFDQVSVTESFILDYMLLKANCKQHSDLLNQLADNLIKGQVISFIVDFPVLSASLNHIMSTHLNSSHTISLLCYKAALRLNKIIGNIFSKKLILQGSSEIPTYENLFDEEAKQYFGDYYAKGLKNFSPKLFEVK